MYEQKMTAWVQRQLDVGYEFFMRRAGPLLTAKEVAAVFLRGETVWRWRDDVGIQSGRFIV